MIGFFQHPQAIVETKDVGDGTRIWAFAHVLSGARIGENCNICDHTFVENDVVLGDNVTIKCGVQVWDGIRIEDDVFVGPNATFTNDPLPRSGQHLDEYPLTTVRKGASIGANATILPGVEVGRSAIIGAGAVVTHDVPPYAVVVGNPARIVRYTSEAAVYTVAPPSERLSESEEPEVIVDGVLVHYAPIVRDLRGNLTARQEDDGLPFTPRRYFVVYDVPSPKVRGAHAHRKCQQLLVALKGSLNCMVDDGKNRQEFLLDSPERALYLPPFVWGVQYKFSPDAMLLVLASDLYDPDDYIRDYDQFIEERQAQKRGRP